MVEFDHNKKELQCIEIKLDEMKRENNRLKNQIEDLKRERVSVLWERDFAGTMETSSEFVNCIEKLKYWFLCSNFIYFLPLNPQKIIFSR